MNPNDAFWAQEMARKQEVLRAWEAARTVGSNRQERRAAERAMKKKLKRGNNNAI